MMEKANQKNNNQQPKKVEETQFKEAKVEIPKTEMFGVVSNCEKLNVREGTSKESKKLTVIDAGERVKILKPDVDGWTGIAVEYGPEGYVMSEYITIV